MLHSHHTIIQFIEFSFFFHTTILCVCIRKGGGGHWIDRIANIVITPILTKFCVSVFIESNARNGDFQRLILFEWIYLEAFFFVSIFSSCSEIRFTFFAFRLFMKMNWDLFRWWFSIGWCEISMYGRKREDARTQKPFTTMRLSKFAFNVWCIVIDRETAQNFEEFTHTHTDKICTRSENIIR